VLPKGFARCTSAFSASAPLAHPWRRTSRGAAGSWTLGEAADYLDPIRLSERQAGVELRG
jgi:hypothetical protein